MTATIEPAEPAEPTDATTAVVDPATEPARPHRSVFRAVLVTALTTALVLGAVGVALYIVDGRSTPAPAAQTSSTPAASATPAEKFLDLWHHVQPGVAARQPDYYWTRIGTSACSLIGIPGITPQQIARALGSNPELMSVSEGAVFLAVANGELCPERTYVAAPTITMPKIVVPDLPDFGTSSPSSSGSGWIPSVGPGSAPSVHAPTIPGTGSSSGGSGASLRPSGGSSGGGTITVPPPLRKQPPQMHTEG